MKYIYKENENLINILGKQNYNRENSYRLCHYIIKENVDNGLLVYNNITKALILLNKNEENKLNDFLNNNVMSPIVEKLISKWFIVDVNFDELKVTDQIKELYLTIKKFRAKEDGSAKAFTILTTTACNARCFYCFERGCKIKTMDNKTADDVANYIIKKVSSSKNKKASLSWFGGEPLLGHKQTSYICNKLAESNIEYSSKMISNGYLFDEDMIKLAKDDWHLYYVQITLDGTQDTYNKIKSYIYKDDKNPFKRVVENIYKLIENEIFVVIRLNLSPSNYKDIENLILYLSDYFKEIKNKKDKNGKNLLMVYTHTIFQELDKAYEKNIEINDNLRKLYSWEFKFEKMINKLGLASSNMLPRHVSLNYCMADSGDCEIILPDGKLGICEHYVDGLTNTFSDIYSDKIDQKLLDSWKEKIPKQDMCKTCAYYPTCMQIKKCPNSREKCYEEDRNYHISKMHFQLQNDYSNYKSILENE